MAYLNVHVHVHVSMGQNYFMDFHIHGSPNLSETCDFNVSSE